MFVLPASGHAFEQSAKRLAVFTLKTAVAGAFLASLVACGGQESQGDSGGVPSPTAVTIHLALDRSSDIEGPDTNGNGVRDDVEAWINGLPATDLQRKALMQDARATQRTLTVDLKDKAALQRTGEG